MKVIPVTITAKVWMWQGKGAWHFITISAEDAEGIVEQYIWPRKGFGAIPVLVSLGKTKWKTSIFPEKGGSYLLPIKKNVRDAENITEGDLMKVVVEVIN